MRQHQFSKLYRKTWTISVSRILQIISSVLNFHNTEKDFKKKCKLSYKGCCPNLSSRQQVSSNRNKNLKISSERHLSFLQQTYFKFRSVSLLQGHHASIAANQPAFTPCISIKFLSGSAWDKTFQIPSKLSVVKEQTVMEGKTLFLAPSSRLKLYHHCVPPLEIHTATQGKKSIKIIKRMLELS